MPRPTVQRFLIAYLRDAAPLALAEATAELRATYAARMKAAAGRNEQHVIARQYRKARVAMVIRLAGIASSAR